MDRECPYPAGFLSTRRPTEESAISRTFNRSNAASSAAFSNAPLLSLSHPLAWAVMIVSPGSARASPFGVPWSKRMSIDRRGIDRGGRLPRCRNLEALGHKIEYPFDLLPRHVELLHHFFDAQILKVLDHGRNGQSRITKHPGAAYSPRHAFDGGALGPIESCHRSSRPFIAPIALLSQFGASRTGYRTIFTLLILCMRGLAQEGPRQWNRRNGERLSLIESIARPGSR